MTSKAERYRAEIYAVNNYLKKIEQKKFDDLKKALNAGESIFLNDSIYNSDDSSDRCQTSDFTDAKKGNSSNSNAMSRNVKTVPTNRKGSFGGV